MVLPESQLMLHNVGLNPRPRPCSRFSDFLGAPINSAPSSCATANWSATSAVRHAPLKGGTVSGATTAEMIDELPMIAALGPFTEEGIEIRDAQEFRVKESDRIAAIAEGFRADGRHRRKNSRTACAWRESPPENCAAQKSTRKAITASPWHFPSPLWAPMATPRFATPNASASLSRNFFKTLEKLRGAEAAF